ncbi:hypothetical protein GCM10010360_53780 [Streptomyces nogalater]
MERTATTPCARRVARVAKDGANMARSRRFNGPARGNNPSGPASGPGAGTPHHPHTAPPAVPTTTSADPREPRPDATPPGAGTSRAGLRRLSPPRAPGPGPFLPGEALPVSRKGPAHWNGGPPRT